MITSRIAIHHHAFSQGGDLSSLLSDHDGSGNWLFMLILDGHLTLKVADSQLDCGPGMIVCPPEATSSPELLVNGSLESYVLGIPPSMIWEIASSKDFVYFPKSRTCQYFEVGEERLAMFSRYLKAISGTMALDEMNTYEAVRNLAMAFLCNCFKEFSIREIPSEPGRTELLTRDFIKLVINNCQKERQMLFYADRLGVSSKYLASVVSSVTGRPASRWIEEFSISCAMSFLRETKLSVSQISDRMAFKSSSDFSKYFRKGTGMSPSEYRLGF